MPITNRHNYYPEVDKLFKKLYFLNQDWFKVRDKFKIDGPEMKKLFDIQTKMFTYLMEIEDILRKETK